MHAGVRGEHRARELSGLTVGIVGFGNIGRLVARYLSGMRCRILYFDVKELEVGREGELGAEAVGSLAELLRRSDVVTVHVPNLPSTNGRLTGRKLMGQPEFALMKPSAIYISTCRGPVTDHDALVDALRSGRIFGAGLDVLDPDPNTESPLLDMEQVTVLPHMSPVGTPPSRALGFLMDNIRRLGAGRPLLAVCNGPGHSDGLFEAAAASHTAAARL
jgi:phosphoglycerate dehydrogenase-like enzyme